MKTPLKSSAPLLNSILDNKFIAITVWIAAVLYGSLRVVFSGEINNYLVFKHVYLHTLQGVNLYIPYPAEHADINLYGPSFSLVIAPFSYLPDNIACVAWAVFNAAVLALAIFQLPVSGRWKNIMLLLCAPELMSTSSALQCNALVCACLLLAFSLIKKEKEQWALLFIMIPAFIKIYGLAGLAFFIFSKKKPAFILWAFVWSFVLFFAPLLITSFHFLVQCYQDWIEGLRIKAAKNSLLGDISIHQNISVPGMIRRIFHLEKLNDLLILIIACFLFASQYLKYRFAQNTAYQFYFLASTLLFIILFSTGTEGSTYIIAMPGLVLWYLLQPKSKLLIVFGVIAFLYTSFTMSDIFTPWMRNHISKPYSTKALFPFITWIIIIIQIHKLQFLKTVYPNQLLKQV